MTSCARSTREADAAPVAGVYPGRQAICEEAARGRCCDPRTLARPGADAFYPTLRTHKLKGALAGCWASSAGYDLRIVFELVPHDGSEAILLLSVGTHDEVY